MSLATLLERRQMGECLVLVENMLGNVSCQLRRCFELGNFIGGCRHLCPDFVLHKSCGLEGEQGLI